MAVAHIQTTYATSDASATTIACAFASNVTAGSLLVVTAAWADGGVGNAPTITDTRGNTYSPAGSAHFDTPNGQGQHTYYVPNTTAGANTVTATFSTATTYRRIEVTEVSGGATTSPVDAVSKFIGTSTTSTDSVTSGSATTTTAGCYIYGAFQRDGNTVTITSGTGFTQRLNLTDVDIEDMTQASAGSVAATWTTNAPTTYLATMVAFKPAGGGGSNVTDTARTGSGVWAGVKAASAASVVALAATGSLTWSGIKASSTTAVTRTDTTRVGGLTWSGIRATSPTSVVHTAHVGSLSMSGVSPVLSIEDVVAGTGPGMVAWSGVRATSTALGGGVAGAAKVGGLTFGGVLATSTSSTIATGSVGGLTWSGIRATSAADLTSPTRLGFLGWSGVRAASTTAVIQNETARLGAWSWAGVHATSTADSVSTANAGAQSWSGVQATSVAQSFGDGTAVRNPRAALTTPTGRATLTTPTSRGTMS